MIDHISLQRVQQLHPANQHAAIQLLLDSHSIGISIRYTSTLRNWAEQDILYAKGRTAPGYIVTRAKGGQSFHNYGFAVDFCLLLKNGKAVSWSLGDDNNFDGKPDFMQVISLAKKLGYKSGSDWSIPDYPHLQSTHGLTIDECQKRHNDGSMDKNGYIFIK